MADFLGSGDEVRHFFPLDNVEDVLFPPLYVVVGRGYLKGFSYGAADRAELALQGVCHDDPDAMPMQAPRQRQCRGKTPNCQ
jgi:hypothetical protein